MVDMVQKETLFLEILYERYPGRVAISVAYSEGMTEVFPIVISDRQGNILGIVAMAAIGDRDSAAVHIYHLSVFNQRNGHGTKMLQILCHQADLSNIVLCLSPIPSPNGEEHIIGSHKLISWYRQFGFEGDTSLCRQPRPEPT